MLSVMIVDTTVLFMLASMNELHLPVSSALSVKKNQRNVIHHCICLLMDCDKAKV